MAAAQPRFCTSFAVGGTTYRHSTEDFYDSSDYFYAGTLLDYPDLRSRLQHRTWGVYERETARLVYGNADASWNTLLAAQELRGVDISLQYYDADTGGAPVTQVVGQIVSVDAREQTIVIVEMRRFDILETLIPTKVVNTADFPKATDLGAAINIISGEAKAIPLRYIHYDFTNDYYDYLICEPGPNQTLDSVDMVYRNGQTISPLEYTVYDGTQGAPHGGYAFIRFIKEQKDFDTQLYALTADVTMGSRDFADYIKEILVDTTWGLGESINAVSFAAATAALTGIGDYYCDGAVTIQRKARDVIEELLDICFGHLYQNTSKEWVIEIDATHDNSPVATFGFNDGLYNNILEIKKNEGTPTDEALKSITLQYGRQASGNELIYENTRTVFGFGKDEIVRTDFVNNGTTADKYTCRRKNLAIYSDNGMAIVVGEDGRDLAIKDVITLEVPDWSITAARYRIEEIIKGENTFELEIKEYVSDIYGYAVGTIPDSADSSIGTMWGTGDVQLPGDETLIAYYKLDLKNTTVAIDHSGYGHNGTIVNTPSWSYGISGMAIVLDDDDSQYITIPDSDVLDTVACISCWVVLPTFHADVGEDYHIIVSKHSGCNFGLYVDYSKTPNEIVAVFEDSNGLTSTASYGATYGQFMYIVAQVNPTLNGAELFIDSGRVAYDAAGALVDIDGLGVAKSGAPVLIGGGIADRYSNIVIDDIRLYDSNLEPGEIRALWLNRGGNTNVTILEADQGIIQSASGGFEIDLDNEIILIEYDDAFVVRSGAVPGKILFKDSGGNITGAIYEDDEILYIYNNLDLYNLLMIVIDSNLTAIRSHGDFLPYSDNFYYSGSIDYSWKGVYSYAYYDEGGNPIDDEPDLDILHSLWDNAIEIDGKKKHNLISCPEFLTNRAILREKAKEKKGIETDEEFEALLRDPNEKEYTLKRNIGANLDLTQGTIREVDRKYKREIADLKEQLSILTDEINKIKIKVGQ